MTFWPRSDVLIPPLIGRRAIRICCAPAFRASPLSAGSPDLAVLRCRVEGGKQLEVCADTEAVRYSFGHIRAPELELANPVTASGYRPWPGVSRTIWDSVAFINGAYVHEAVTSLERIHPEDEDTDITEHRRDGIYVLQNKVPVGELTCLPETVESAVDLLHDHLGSHCICWSFSTYVWEACE